MESKDWEDVVMRSHGLILGVSALVWPGLAQAQSPAASDSTAGEIIVTAQKVDQRLQDVPLSVTVVGGDTLSEYGATSLRDIAVSVPTLQLDSTYGVPGSNSLTLRGVTTGDQASSTVATYIDDVPVGSSASFAAGNIVGLDLFPYDLERVEVLGGPQGTLYGASSLGGLVKYVTRVPSLTENSLRLGSEVLTIDRASNIGAAVRAAASVVLSPDKLSVGMSGTYQYTPGYIDNVATGGDDINHGIQAGLRGTMHWKPTERFTLKASALYNHSDFADIGLISAAPGGGPLFGDYVVASNQPNRQQATNWLGSAVADYEFDFASLTSVTAYSDSHVTAQIDGSAVFRPLFGIDAAFISEVRIKKFTQELRLASSPENRFHWLLGAFFTREKTSYGQVGNGLIPGSSTPAPAPFNVLIDAIIPSTYREWAGFANGTFKITEAWDVSAGARYSANRQVISERIAGLLVGAPVVLADRQSSDDAVTYTLGTSYKFGQDAMIYARVASGYRPGGPNFVVPGLPDSYEPDSLTNYEIGLKSNLLDRRLTFNVAAFHIDWRDIQLQGRTPTNLAYVSNGGQATSTGVEASATLRAAPGLTLGGAIAYTDTELKDSAVLVGGVAGDRLPVTPRWAGAATADYSFAIGENRATIGLSWRYTGPRDQFFPANPANNRLKAYDVFNARAGIGLGRVDLNIFVRNLANSKAFTSWRYVGGPAVLQPRTIGVSIDLRM